MDVYYDDWCVVGNSGISDEKLKSFLNKKICVDFTEEMLQLSNFLTYNINTESVNTNLSNIFSNTANLYLHRLAENIKGRPCDFHDEAALHFNLNLDEFIYLNLYSATNMECFLQMFTNHTISVYNKIKNILDLELFEIIYTNTNKILDEYYIYFSIIHNEFYAINNIITEANL